MWQVIRLLRSINDDFNFQWLYIYFDLYNNKVNYGFIDFTCCDDVFDVAFVQPEYDLLG